MLLTAFALVGIWRPTYAAEAYWPGWLGPKHNGWVADFKPPEKWPEKLKKTPRKFYKWSKADWLSMRVDSRIWANQFVD